MAEEIRNSCFEFRMCAISTAMIPPREVPMMVSSGVMLFCLMIVFARLVRVKVLGVWG